MAVVTGTKFQVNDEIYYIDGRLNLRKSTIETIVLTVHRSGCVHVVYTFKDGSSVYEDKCYKTYKEFFDEVKNSFNNSIDKELDKVDKLDMDNISGLSLPEMIKIMIKK